MVTVGHPMLGQSRQLQGPGLRYHLPPFEGKGHPADVGTGADVSDLRQVTVKVIDEGALETQGLQQAANLFFQAAGPFDLGPKRLGDPQVLAHHNHPQLSERKGEAWTGIRGLKASPRPAALWSGQTRCSTQAGSHLLQVSETQLASAQPSNGCFSTARQNPAWPRSGIVNFSSSYVLIILASYGLDATHGCCLHWNALPTPALSVDCCTSFISQLLLKAASCHHSPLPDHTELDQVRRHSWHQGLYP